LTYRAIVPSEYLRMTTALEGSTYPVCHPDEGRNYCPTLQ
jgi:hypothetical protein